MPEFMSKLLLLIEESKGWLTSILLPIYISYVVFLSH